VHFQQNQIRLCFVTNLMEHPDEENPDFHGCSRIDWADRPGPGANSFDGVKLVAPNAHGQHGAKRMVRFAG
jgi:hypothetical protein